MMLALWSLLLFGALEPAPVQVSQAEVATAGDLTVSRVVLLDRVGRDGPVTEIVMLVRNAGPVEDELISAASPIGAAPAIRVDSHRGGGRRAVITRSAPYPIPTSASLGERGQIIISVSFSADADQFPAGAPVTLRFARAGEVTVTASPPSRRR